MRRRRASEKELEEFRAEFGTEGVEEFFDVGPEAPGRPELPPLPGSEAAQEESEQPGPEWQGATNPTTGERIWFNPETGEVRPRG